MTAIRMAWPGRSHLRRTRSALSPALALVAAIAASSPGLAQSTLGTIRGTVFDPQHQVAPGATIVVTDEATALSRETTSDGNGNFVVDCDLSNPMVQNNVATGGASFPREGRTS